MLRYAGAWARGEDCFLRTRELLGVGLAVALWCLPFWIFLALPLVSWLISMLPIGAGFVSAVVTPIFLDEHNLNSGFERFALTDRHL